MGFPRQEYGIGLPFPSPRDPPDSGIKPMSSKKSSQSTAHTAPLEALSLLSLFVFIESQEVQSVSSSFIKYFLCASIHQALGLVKDI